MYRFLSNLILKYFRRKAAAKMFDSVVNTPLLPAFSVKSSQTKFLLLCWQMIDFLDLINLAIYVTLSLKSYCVLKVT